MEKKQLYDDSQSSPIRFWGDADTDGNGSSRSPTTFTANNATHARQRIIGLSKPRSAQQTAVPSSDLNRPRTPGRKAGQGKAESRKGRSAAGASQEVIERSAEKGSSSNSAKKDTPARSRTKKPPPTVVEALDPFPLSVSDDELDLMAKTVDDDIQLEADLRKARRTKLSGKPTNKAKPKDHDITLASTEDKITKPRRTARKNTKRKSPSPVSEESDRERKDLPDPLTLTDDDSPVTSHLAHARSLSPVVLESFALGRSPPRSPYQPFSPASSPASSVIVCQSPDRPPEPFPLSPQKSTPIRCKTTRDLSSPLGRKGNELGESPEWARRRESSIVDLSDSTPKRTAQPRSTLGRKTDCRDLTASGLRTPSVARGKKRKSPEAARVVVLVSEDDSDSPIAGPSTPVPRSSRNANLGESAKSSSLSSAGDLSLQGDPDTYHATWLCPYCGKYMPVHMSNDLLARYHKLKELSARAEINKAEPLSWQQTLDFCAAHEAEATIVPKGIKAGYPTEIDFSRLVERMEAPWFRQRLAAIARIPGRSRLFRRAEEDVRQIGRLAWRAAGHQQTDRVRSSTRAGYYGELGRMIILQHLQCLLEWRCFPALLSGKDGSPPACAPLQPNDFFIHVLVPEAAILLIMEDQRCGESMPPANFAAAKTAAKRLWRESAEYGVWRFREDDEEGEKVIRRLLDNRDNIERMVREGRAAALAEKRKKKQQAAAVHADRRDNPPIRRSSAPRQQQHADAIVISDTTSESAFSDTSADTLELDTIGKDKVLESPLRFKHITRGTGWQDDTPRATRASQVVVVAHGSQASSTFGDSFGEEAFILADEAQAMHSKRRKS